MRVQTRATTGGKTGGPELKRGERLPGTNLNTAGVKKPGAFGVSHPACQHTSLCHIF